ncbi:MAG: hypothetical protein MZV65_35650 [Chromatiales bacterium]|nr:hypothetical protein [Chromatiales bacterium]
MPEVPPAAATMVRWEDGLPAYDLGSGRPGMKPWGARSTMSTDGGALLANASSGSVREMRRWTAQTGCAPFGDVPASRGCVVVGAARDLDAALLSCQAGLALRLPVADAARLGAAHRRLLSPRRAGWRILLRGWPDRDVARGRLDPSSMDGPSCWDRAHGLRWL